MPHRENMNEVAHWILRTPTGIFAVLVIGIVELVRAVHTGGRADLIRVIVIFFIGGPLIVMLIGRFSRKG
jgi:hypothetical protein